MTPSSSDGFDASDHPLRRCMYVKNTFLEFLPTEEPGEENISSEQSRGVPRASEEVESVKNIWASMKERHKTRAKSHPASRKDLESLMHSCFRLGAGTSTSSTSGDLSERSSASQTPHSTRSQSPASSLISGSLSPRSVMPLESTEALHGAAPTSNRVVPSHSPESLSVSKKKVRSRPPKPKRMKGKDLARLLFSVQDATSEEQEQAERYFLQATAGDPVLYEYSMSVLQSMKFEDGIALERDEENTPTSRSEQEGPFISYQTSPLDSSQASTLAHSPPSVVCINLPRPSTALPLMSYHVPAR